MSSIPNSTATSPNSKVNNTNGTVGMGAKPGQATGQQAPANNASTYAAPVGNTEKLLTQMLMQGGSPFVNSIANGQVPPAILKQFQDQQNLQRSQILEGMGGSRYGSDAASAVARAQGQGLTSLMAGTENNALQASQLNLQRQLGLGAPLLSAETQRNQNAQTLAFQDFLRQTGLPPELAALLGAAGLGGGTTTGQGNTSGQNWGVNLLGSL